MRLEDIIKGTEATIVEGTPKMEIPAIYCDSRKVTPGSLFIAVNGCSTDEIGRASCRERV